jgi:rubredoxin
MFGSVIIRRKENKKANRLKSLERFDILHTKDFNPNSKDLVVYRESVEKDFIGTYLVSLCKYFYELGSDKNVAGQPPVVKGGIDSIENDRIVHQCRHCLTVYDEAAGDAENNINGGTPFKELPPGYQCPLCAAPKADFITVTEKSLHLASA